MLHRPRPRLVALAALLLVAIPGVTAAAPGPGGKHAADTGATGSSTVRFVSPSGEVLVLNPTADLVDRAAYDPEADASAARADRSGSTRIAAASSRCPYAATLSNSKTVSAWAPSKPASSFTAAFSSSWSYNWNPTTGITRFCIDGHSWARWWGTNPSNASLLGITDTWSVSGLGVSISFPPGAGFSASGSQLTFFPGNAANTWKEDHYFSGIEFNGISLWGACERASGQVKLGTNWFYAVAQAGC